MDTPAVVGEIQQRRIEELNPYADNARVHSPAQVDQLAESIRTYGFNAPVIIDEGGVIIAGHGRVLAATKLGMESVPCIVASHLTPEQVRAYRLVDNKVASQEWDVDALMRELDSLTADFEIKPMELGFSADELEKIASELTESQPEITPPKPKAEDDGFDIDKALEKQKTVVTQQGDLWKLGKHRLVCGDCTDEKARALAFGSATMELVLTDPPYCSGGFQEAQRGSGSIGTQRIMDEATGKKGTPTILNDALSTRGYIALMKSALSGFPVVAAYVFTDWRMWVNLHDVMESSGYSVRNMIVWDKGTPGMGVGWRAQHEIVMYALRGKLKTDNKKAVGNVVQSKRTGNVHHPTQKPVDLLGVLMHVPDLVHVYDPFTGSGSTLIACEQTERTFYGIEMDPAFCDAAVRRWEEYTGEKAERIPAKIEAMDVRLP